MFSICSSSDMGYDSPMATTIEWTDATWNPVTGCTKISAGCDHCYAESWAKRGGHPELWNGERRRTKTWGDPVKWNKAAKALGIRDYGRVDFRVSTAGEPFFIEATGHPHIQRHSSFYANGGSPFMSKKPRWRSRSTISSPGRNGSAACFTRRADNRATRACTVFKAAKQT